MIPKKRKTSLTISLVARSLCLGGDAGGETSRAAPVPLLPSHASPPPAKPGGYKDGGGGALSLHRLQWSWSSAASAGTKKNTAAQISAGCRIRYPMADLLLRRRQLVGKSPSRRGGGPAASALAGRPRGVELARRRAGGMTVAAATSAAWRDLARWLAVALAAWCSCGGGGWRGGAVVSGLRLRQQLRW